MGFNSGFKGLNTQPHGRDFVRLNPFSSEQEIFHTFLVAESLLQNFREEKILEDSM